MDHDLLQRYEALAMEAGEEEENSLSTTHDIEEDDEQEPNDLESYPFEGINLGAETLSDILLEMEQKAQNMSNVKEKVGEIEPKRTVDWDW